MNLRAQLRWVLLAVLIGLQGPLCAMACIADSAPLPGSVANHPDATAPPCHEPVESTEPGGDAECACRDSVDAVPVEFDSSVRNHNASALAFAVVLGTAPAPLELAPRHQWTRRVPPPGILLLKSTLII